MPEPAPTPTPPGIAAGDTLSVGPEGSAPDGAEVPARIGHYELLAELGRGGMGSVYRARDTRLGRDVALKLVTIGGDAASQELVDRFQREAQAAGRLSDHPNVVGVHDVGSTGDLLYLAMDLVQGRTLAALVADGDFAYDEVAGLVEQVARAAHHAHVHGVLHRDIKPANVLVGDDGVPRLADFGLARTHGGPELTQLTQTGTVLGTPAYMPPEQAQGEGLDPRADVYALGATLYHALVGAAPFESETLVALLMQVVEGKFEPPRKRNPDIPRALDAIVCKAMALEKERRYPSAAALADDLARFRRGDVVQARTASAARGWVRWLGRHPVAAALCAAAAVAAVAMPPLLAGGRERAARTQAQAGTAAQATGDLERAGRISSAYFQLSLATMNAMRRLEDRWHGVPTPPAEVEQLLAEVRTHTAAAGTDPELGVPQAWEGLALFYAGKTEDAERAIAAARARAPHDPFTHLVAARVAFARFAARIHIGSVSFGGHTVQVTPPTESDDSVRLRGVAREALAAGLDEALWRGVQHGAMFRRFGRGASLLATGDWAGAAAALAPLEDHELLGGDAAALAATALLLDSRFAEAGRVLEPLARRGWPEAFERGVTAAVADGVGRQSRGEPADAAYERAVAMCEASLQASPNLLKALDGRAMAQAFWGRTLMARGDDPRPKLQAAVADYDRLVAQLPDDAGVRHNRATVWMDLGRAAIVHGQDPRPALGQALDDIEAAIGLRPGVSDWYRARAELRFQLGQAELPRGGDPIAHYRAALEDLDAATQLDPEDSAPWHTLGNVRRALAIALQQRRADGLPDIDASIEAYSREMELGGATALSLNGRGSAWALRGEYLVAAGRDPASSFDRALEDFGAALTKNPAHASAWGNRGNVWAAKAKAAVARGEDPVPALHKAVADYTGAIQRNPTHPGFRHNRGIARVQLALAADRAGDNPVEPIRGAIDDFGRAVAAAPNRATSWWALVDARRRLAAWTVRSGGDGRPMLEQALRDLQQLQRIWGRRAALHAAIAGVCESLARWGEAAAAWERALQLQPGNVRYQARLRAARERAR